MQSLILLPFLVASTLATGVLLPLYLYPSAVYNDGAANWKPIFSAITANPSVNWQVVINPHNGPGLTGLPGDNDINYINGTAQFNDLPHVRTIGYVRTLNGQAPLSEVEANITTWAKWNNYTSSNISIHGIFFDEAIEPSGVSNGANLAYLTNATNFARQMFGDSTVTICNFGAKPDPRYYSICSEIIVFESCLDNNSGSTVCTTSPLPPQYENQTTINANIPNTAYASQAAIVVHDFVGTTYNGLQASVTTLDSYVHTLKANNVGWAYFCSGEYSSVTTGPATIGALGSAVASA